MKYVEGGNISNYNQEGVQTANWSTSANYTNM